MYGLWQLEWRWQARELGVSAWSDAKRTVALASALRCAGREGVANSFSPVKLMLCATLFRQPHWMRHWGKRILIHAYPIFRSGNLSFGHAGRSEKRCADRLRLTPMKVIACNCL